MRVLTRLLVLSAVVALSLVLATLQWAGAGFTLTGLPQLDYRATAVLPSFSMRVIQRSAGESQLPGYTRFVCLSDTHGIHRDSSLLKVRKCNKTTTFGSEHLGYFPCSHPPCTCAHTDTHQPAGSQGRCPCVRRRCRHRLGAASAFVCLLARRLTSHNQGADFREHGLLGGLKQVHQGCPARS